MANDKKEKVGAVKAEFKPAAADETGFKRVPININDPDNQSKLVDLNWYLGIANPIYKKATIKIERKKDGKVTTQDVEKKVFDHFEYPNVAGEKFEDWLKKNFGDNVKVDTQTKEVYTLESDKDTPTPEPNTNTDTEQTQPQNNPEVNPNDPQNN